MATNIVFIFIIIFISNHYFILVFLVAVGWVVELMTIRQSAY